MPRVSAGHQERQREWIVVVTEACFVENDLHVTSMDDIVDATGISTSTIYNYFPDGKNELIVTVHKEQTDAVFARIVILVKRESPPSLREVYAEVALTFWQHMEKMERERFRGDEKDAPDEGEQTSEKGRQRPGKGGWASGDGDATDDVHMDEASRISGEMGRIDGVGPPEWTLRSARLAVNTWAETIRNPGLNQDMRRRRSEFRETLTVPADRWKTCGVVDPALSTTDAARLLMDNYFGATADFVITSESRYERPTAAFEGVLSPREGWRLRVYHVAVHENSAVPARRAKAQI